MRSALAAFPQPVRSGGHVCLSIAAGLPRSPSMFRRVIDGLCCVVRGKPRPRQRDFWRQRPLLAELLEDRTNPSVIAVGDEFIVDEDMGSDNPAVAIDASGRFVVVADGWDEAIGSGIFARRFDQNGTPLGASFPVVLSPPGYFGHDLSVAMDADGDFVVVWNEWQELSSEIYARRYDADGLPQGAAFLVNTCTTDWQANPSVAMDADGGFVVVWDSDWQDGSAHGVFGQRYDTTGTPQGNEFQINTCSTSDQVNPSVAMAAAGDFVVVWKATGRKTVLVFMPSDTTRRVFLRVVSST